MKANTNYKEIPAEKVPSGIRFDVPAANGGQIVEVAYGDKGPGENGPGSAFKRVTDRSDNQVTYYKRVGAMFV